MKNNRNSSLIFRTLIVCLLGLFVFNTGSAQRFEVRSYLGVSYYQGDLSPLPIDLSFSKGHLSGGVSTGFHVSKLFSIHTKYIKGTLSGTDSDASTLDRRRRNLSFRTDFSEYGLITEFNLNALFKKLDRYGIEFYYSTGVNLFRFNPQTQINGQFVDLQPLGTEGQNIAGVGVNKKYSLTQFNIPFGIGTKFKIGDKYSLGIEIAPRWTFTDYIDDVSTEYVGYDVLLEEGGALVATLANRTGEYLNTAPVTTMTGQQRGDPTDNDWYLFTSVYFSYKIGAALPVLPPKEMLKSATKLAH